MTNPYEPPAESSTVEASDRSRKPDPTIRLRLIIAIVVTSATLFVAYLPSVHDPAIAFTGPLWMLRITRQQIAALAIVAFCVSGVGSLIVWPRWSTGVFATAAVVVWLGTSFYMLVLTAPD